jgi:hypothetical protein
MIRQATGAVSVFRAITRARRYMRNGAGACVVPVAAATALVTSVGAAAIPVTARSSAGDPPSAARAEVAHTSAVPLTPVNSAAQNPTLRWGPPERIANKRASEDFDRARVVVRGRQALAVWDAPVKGAPRTIQLRVASRGVDGVWSPPQRIARFHAGFVQLYQAALGPHGDAIVVWSYGDTIGHVMETHREAGTWSRPTRLGGNTSGMPQAVIDGNGEMTVAWTSFPDGSRIDVASRAAEGNWGEVQHLGRFGGDPTLTANRRGDVAVAWGTDAGVSVAIRRHGRGWGTAHDLHSVIGFPDVPQLAMDATGRVMVMWSRSTEEEETFTRRHLAWARTRSNGTWTRVRYLDTRRHIVFGSVPSLSLGRHGHALAVWWTQTARRSDMRASRFRLGHGWSHPRDLGRSCCDPVALLTPSQTAVALLGRTRSGRDTVWAYQRPGQAWTTRTVHVPFVTDASGLGEHMAMVYYGPRLTSRMLTVPAATAGGQRP